MMRFQKFLLVVLTSSAVFALVIGSNNSGAVHEWGTFTSVAGADGAAIRWESLSGKPDLPCFVHFLEHRNWKAGAFGKVRMETPVMYFYPSKPMTVSVHVDFPGGRVTEWYPKATSVQPASSINGWIEWKDIQVGNTGEPLLKLAADSHYYVARETDGCPLRSGSEIEKLLFYRGIADFDVDLKPVVGPDGVLIRKDGTETIPQVILFENHAGQMGYHVIRRLDDPVSVKFSDLKGTMENLRGEFENELVEMGLYRKEAHAMIETWRDSWFEDGLRVFYVVPRAKVDTLLPVSIQPAPAQLARVFVGRVELLSPWMRKEISRALLDGDVAVLKKYGRFLNAFLGEMGDGSGDAPMCARASQFLERSYTDAPTESLKTSCKQ